MAEQEHAPTLNHPAWQALKTYMALHHKPFRLDWCNSFDSKVHEAYRECQDKAFFYRDTDVYLYQNTGFHLDGYKRPYYAVLFRIIGSEAVTILDYGCGCGYDGSLFLLCGLHASFADVQGEGTRFLQWRLSMMGHSAPIYDLAQVHVIQQHDIVWCIDVLEHLPTDAHRDFLLQLEQLGRTVLVNLVDDKSADGTVHYPVDVDGLTEFVARRRRLWYNDYHTQSNGNKSRLLVIGERANRL